MSLQSKIHISTHFDDEDQRRQADVRNMITSKHWKELEKA